MSSEQRMFSSFSPGAVESFSGEDPQSSPLSDMETLRRFVNERLAEAVEEILGLFGKTVARYRDQIDRQQRQLDSLRSEEDKRSQGADPAQASSWIRSCPEDPILRVQLDETSMVTEPDSDTVAAQIKTEADREDCGASEPDFDPAGCDGPLRADPSDTEDSGDYWREAAALWSPEDTEGQRSANLSHELPPGLTCKVCGEAFQRKSPLLTHTSAHPRDCGVCGKHLEHGDNLKLHLRVHRETSFCCSVCGQSFTLRGNLRTHMRIHSGERPFGCTVCGKSFGRRATLVRHVRSHTGEKPFTCTYCGRAFVEKGNLTVHLRTHTGERPYWCSTCDRRFSQLSCFYKHPCQRRHLSSALLNPT
ncbi:zinc finger protein 32-like [Anabas testudineus]|uniref:zinc finger protein 32-like n=1 Tax=Anabas testudineus TaxID=64144 RepID=UPI000E4569AB|nr:zinc finger protein 32-like [Anabas testudineus]